MNESIKIARQRALVERHLAGPLAMVMQAIDTGDLHSAAYFGTALAEAFTEYERHMEKLNYRPVIDRSTRSTPAN